MLALVTWSVLQRGLSPRIQYVLKWARGDEYHDTADAAGSAPCDRERLLDAEDDGPMGVSRSVHGVSQSAAQAVSDDTEHGAASGIGRPTCAPVLNPSHPHGVSLEGVKAANAIFDAPEVRDALNGAGGKRHDGRVDSGPTHCGEVSAAFQGVAPSSQRLKSIFATELDAALAGLRTSTCSSAPPLAPQPWALQRPLQVPPRLPPSDALLAGDSYSTMLPVRGPSRNPHVPVATPPTVGQLLMSQAMADAADESASDEDDERLHAKFGPSTCQRSDANFHPKNMPSATGGVAAQDGKRRLTPAERRALGGRG